MVRLHIDSGRQLTNAEVAVLREIKEWMDKQIQLNDMTFRDIKIVNNPNDKRSMYPDVRWVKSPTGKSLVGHKVIVINSAYTKNLQMFKSNLSAGSLYEALYMYNHNKVKTRKAKDMNNPYIRKRAQYNKKKASMPKTDRSIGRANFNAPKRKVKLRPSYKHKHMWEQHVSKGQVVNRIKDRVYLTDKQEKMIKDYLYGGKK
mgnify:CR=1 FL=1|nr:MAG TPA: hypothetical protein [Caudoviricetes sp.]